MRFPISMPAFFLIATTFIPSSLCAPSPQAPIKQVRNDALPRRQNSAFNTNATVAASTSTINTTGDVTSNLTGLSSLTTASPLVGSPTTTLASELLSAASATSPTASSTESNSKAPPILINPSDGPQGVRTISVTESIDMQETSLGTVITHCITTSTEPPQTFCRTVLDGKALDIGGAAAVSPSSAASSLTASSLTVATTAQTSWVSTATQGSLTAAVALDSGSSSTPSATITTVDVSAVSTSAAASAPETSQISTPAAEVTSILSSIEAASSSASDLSTQSTSISETPTLSATLLSSTSIEAVESTSSSSTGITVSALDAASLTAVAVEPAGVSTEATRSPVITVTIDGPLPSISATASPSSTLISTSEASSSAAFVPVAAAGAGAGEQSNASDQYPGQKIAVLPIGIGIFGGLVDLALCVVGYMLYQRRLYRGQFTRRRDAEHALMRQNSDRAYGGMR